MKKKLIILSLILVFALAFTACTPDTPPVGPAPVEDENGDEAQDTRTAADFVSDNTFISVDEVWEMWNVLGEEKVVTIGVVDPTLGLVPFTNASNPIRGSYLVWSPDYLRANTEEALSPAVAIYRIPLDEMEALLSGVETTLTAETPIVVFASDAQAQGARVLWHLRALGLNARLLDGGNATWRDEGHPTGRSARLNDQAPEQDFRAPNYDMGNFSASFHDVLHAVQNPDEWIIVDVRNDAEFAGERVGASANAYGTGRIAGAVHIEWNRVFGANDMLLPEAELRALFAEVLDGRRIIVYCQGGVRAAHAWAVLTMLGADVLNHDGSWIEWSYAASSAGSFEDRELVRSFTEEWTDNNGPI